MTPNAPFTVPQDPASFDTFFGEVAGEDANVLKMAFSLGWDYAAHGISLPDDADPHTRDGFDTARSRRIRAQSADRYVRKWLQLRSNALRRGRIVSEKVTPDFLRSIDVAVCPVTGITLTHGTGEDSDWSVDRLNNKGAYVPGNLAVISTRVNLIKGAMSLTEVVQAYASDNPQLTAMEWLRLATLMAGPTEAVEDGVHEAIPLVCLPAAYTPMTFAQDLQLYISLHASHPKRFPLKPLRRQCNGAPQDKQLLKLASTFEKLRFKYKNPLEAWAEPKLFDLVQSFLNESNLDAMHRALEKLLHLEHLNPRKLAEAWGVGNNGYYQGDWMAQLGLKVIPPEQRIDEIRSALQVPLQALPQVTELAGVSNKAELAGSPAEEAA